MRRLWKVLIAISAIGLAAFLLYRTLSRYSLDQLLDAIAAVPTGSLVAAGGFAAASYMCLSGFDYLALHYVGRPQPYYRAAWASFTSLSIGHNIGLAFLSSGAVRYRFYTRWGLSAEQVAKVIAFCGITVGLGLIVLGGAALLLRTSLAVEITGLSKTAVIALGIGCLGVAVLYLVLAAIVKAPLRIRRWELAIPPLRLAIGQILVGTVNFACVAVCLHQALAAVTDVAYIGVASVYVIANTTALISHVPGGLGVIESVVMYLLPGQDLIGPLLIFRIVYFLIPLCIGIPVFLLTELIYRRRDTRHAKIAETPVRA